MACRDSVGETDIERQEAVKQRRLSPTRRLGRVLGLAAFDQPEPPQWPENPLREHRGRWIPRCMRHSVVRNGAKRAETIGALPLLSNGGQRPKDHTNVTLRPPARKAAWSALDMLRQVGMPERLPEQERLKCAATPRLQHLAPQVRQQ